MRPDRLARLHAAVDRCAGEQVRIVPYTSGGYLAGQPDASRPPQDIVAEVTEVPKTVRTVGPGSTSGHNAELCTASHTIKFMTSRLPYKVGDSDHVILLERGDAELEVNSADPFGTDRTILRLERLSP